MALDVATANRGGLQRLPAGEPSGAVGVDLDERLVCTLNAPFATRRLHGVVAVQRDKIASDLTATAADLDPLAPPLLADRRPNQRRTAFWFVRRTRGSRHHRQRLAAVVG